MAAGPTCAARGGMIQAGSWTLCDTFTHLPSCAQNSPPVDFPLTVRLQRTLPLLQQDDPAPHTRVLTCHIDSWAECDTAFAFTFGDRGSSHPSFLPFPFTWSDSRQGFCIVMIDDRTVFPLLANRLLARPHHLSSFHSCTGLDVCSRHSVVRLRSARQKTRRCPRVMLPRRMDRSGPDHAWQQTLQLFDEPGFRIPWHFDHEVLRVWGNFIAGEQIKQNPVTAHAQLGAARMQHDRLV